MKQSASHDSLWKRIKIHEKNEDNMAKTDCKLNKNTVKQLDNILNFIPVMLRRSCSESRIEQEAEQNQRDLVPQVKDPLQQSTQPRISVYGNVIDVCQVISSTQAQNKECGRTEKGIIQKKDKKSYSKVKSNRSKVVIEITKARILSDMKGLKTQYLIQKNAIQAIIKTFTIWLQQILLKQGVKQLLKIIEKTYEKKSRRFQQQSEKKVWELNERILELRESIASKQILIGKLEEDYRKIKMVNQELLEVNAIANKKILKQSQILRKIQEIGVGGEGLRMENDCEIDNEKMMGMQYKRSQHSQNCVNSPIVKKQELQARSEYYSNSNGKFIDEIGKMANIRSDLIANRRYARNSPDRNLEISPQFCIEKAKANYSKLIHEIKSDYNPLANREKNVRKIQSLIIRSKSSESLIDAFKFNDSKSKIENLRLQIKKQLQGVKFS